MKNITLTASEAQEIKKYSQLLISTVALQVELNAFWTHTELTASDVELVKIDTNGNIVDDGGVTKSVDVNENGALVSSMKYYIAVNEASTSAVVQTALATFAKLVEKL